jgi:hypothetical protein
VSDLAVPVTRYAVSGDINIAYQTLGEGPVDISSLTWLPVRA